MLELLKPRAKRLDDFVAQGRLFFARDIEHDAAAVDKHLRATGMVDHLVALDAAFAALPAFDPVVNRGGASRDRRCAQCEGLCTDSRRACRRDGKSGKSRPVRCACAGRSRARARPECALRFSSCRIRVPDHSHLFPPLNSLTSRRLPVERRSVSTSSPSVQPATENFFRSAFTAEVKQPSWHIGCSPSVGEHATSCMTSPGPRASG